MHIPPSEFIQTFLILGQEPTVAAVTVRLLEEIVRNSQQTARLSFANFQALLVCCLRVVWYDMTLFMSQHIRYGAMIQLVYDCTGTAYVNLNKISFHEHDLESSSLRRGIQWSTSFVPPSIMARTTEISNAQLGPPC